MSTFDRRAFVVRSAGFVSTLAFPRLWTTQDHVDPRVRALARELHGPVITPADHAYDQARVVYNERFDGVHPLGIAQPVSVADVQRVVAWAKKTGVRLAIRSGGHCYAGYSTTSGLVVDLGRLGSVRFDSSGRAHIGPGARLIDVETTLAARNRAIPGGSCPTVAIGGLALGGGVGFASRKFGTTSDNIVSLGIVTADGRYRRCSASENADLFWACRGGGGGNFGIVTDFVFRTHPVSSVSYFFADYPWSQAADVIRAWQAFAPHAPDELFSVCSLGTGSNGPTVRCFGQFFGSEQKLRLLLQPLSRVSGMTLTTGSSSYLDAQLRWAGCLGKSLAQCRIPGRTTFTGKSDYFNAPISRAAAETIVHWIERAQSEAFGSAAFLLDSYGGAINRVPHGATAFVHRNALCAAQYLAYWSSNSGEALAWIRAFYAAMRPHVSGFSYQNYIDRDLTSWKHAYYGRNYARLRAVKMRVDPDRLFRFAQGVD